VGHAGPRSGATKAAFGLRSQLIMCFLRDLSADSAMETLDEPLAYGDSIVCVGLDSDEHGNPSSSCLAEEKRGYLEALEAFAAGDR
jgi:adenine deaminase